MINVTITKPWLQGKDLFKRHIIPLGVTKVIVSKVECADDCLKLNESGSINILYSHLRVESEAHYQEQLCYMAVKIFADFMNEVMSDTQEKKYLTKKK